MLSNIYRISHIFGERQPEGKIYHHLQHQYQYHHLLPPANFQRQNRILEVRQYKNLAIGQHSKNGSRNWQNLLNIWEQKQISVKATMNLWIMWLYSTFWTMEGYRIGKIFLLTFWVWCLLAVVLGWGNTVEMVAIRPISATSLYLRIDDVWLRACGAAVTSFSKTTTATFEWFRVDTLWWWLGKRYPAKKTFFRHKEYLHLLDVPFLTWLSFWLIL